MPTLAAMRDAALPMAGGTLLAEYRPSGGRGDPRAGLGRILSTARRLANEVDRVVIVAAGDVRLAAQAVLESCAHPHHNELSRAQRGGYPRVYFEPGPLDNDALQARLDLLLAPNRGGDLETRWALVTVDDGTLETAIIGRVFRQALQRSLDGDGDWAAKLHVQLSDSVVPDGGGTFSVAALLPAALAGVDIVGLLSGAAAMSNRLAADPLETSPVLQLAGLCHLAGSTVAACRVRAGVKSLAAGAAWYRQRREAAFARPAPRPSAPTRNSTADLHADPLPEKIVCPAIVLSVDVLRVRRDRLVIDGPLSADDPLAAVAGKKLPEIGCRGQPEAVEGAAGERVVQ
ncbi:MAG TPA: hypothetical protein VHY20_00485, partial [Pirellulales bacterium]|nr:hypothetical protein [Pirellulales bacterium]